MFSPRNNRLVFLRDQTGKLRRDISILSPSIIQFMNAFKRHLIILSLGLIVALAPVRAFSQQSGQYTPIQVEVKTRSNNPGTGPTFSDWKPFETRTVDHLLDFKPSDKQAFNIYGSDPSRKSKATGFFRTEKIKDRWWIIDPLGFAGLNVVVNSINRGQSPRSKQVFEEKFKSVENWSAQTTVYLQELGFTGAGSWSEHEALIDNNAKSKKPFSYCINWNFMSSYGKKRGGTFAVPGHTGYPGGAIFVFDPEFEKFCDEHAKQLLKYKDDPNLFGYFSDNEMPLSPKNLEGYLNLENKKDAGYLAAKKWMEERGLTLSQITDKERNQFLAFAGERYFSIVYKAIKKYDPNHLFLGSRLYSKEKNVPEFITAIGPYVDILSMNYYGAWTPNKEYMNNWTAWSGKPFMVTEFYTKGEDSGLPNKSGAGWLVKTQADRGYAYQNFCLGLLESKNCVGWHWFKYIDNDPTDPKAELSNTDANKGIMNGFYEPYAPLAEKMRMLNLNRYALIDYFDKLSK
jgi:hypothetical protein